MAMFGQSIHSLAKEGKVKDYVGDFELENLFKSLTVPSRVKEKLNGKLFASEAGNCARKNVISSTIDLVETMEISGKFYTNVGQCIEEVFAELLEHNSKLISNSLRIYDDVKFVKEFNDNFILYQNDVRIGFSGIIDLIVQNNGELTLIDVKTCGELPEKVSNQYEKQILFYSAVTGIDNVAILYQSRNIKGSFSEPIDLRVIKVSTEYDKLLEVVTTAYFSKLCFENEILPTKNEKYKKTVHCKYCNFSNFCYEGEALELYPLIQDEKLEKELLIKAEELAKKFLENRQNRFRLFYEKFLKGE